MNSFKAISYSTKRRRIISAVAKMVTEAQAGNSLASNCILADAVTAEISDSATLSSNLDQDPGESEMKRLMEDNATNFIYHEFEICDPSGNNDTVDFESNSGHDLFQDLESSDSSRRNFNVVQFDDCDEWKAHDYEIDDDEDTPEKLDTNIRDDLAQWAVKYSISQSALSALLGILKTCDMSELSSLPKDARAILCTPRQIGIQQRAGGEYYYFGIQYWLSIILELFPLLCKRSEISIAVNVDGIPLFNSSSTSLWPILGAIEDTQACPFPIAIFCSSGKPTCLEEYLMDFVSEMKHLQTVGIEHKGNHFIIKLHAVICDAPARAYLKCIKTHSGYESCERCIQHGEWCGKVVFPELSAEPRTDSNFENRLYPNHHIGISVSPFSELSIGMVSKFPLDYMHLVCLGVMRRLINLWMHGPRGTKLSQSQLSLVSDKLASLQLHIPREFARKPRSLSEFSKWKATELRLFLLYTGPVVLKGTLPDELYEIFLVLSVAIRILLDPCLVEQLLNYASDLVRYFVASFGRLYGEGQLVYNVHSLIHLPQDAKLYGSLDRVSAFQFESYLGRLKKLVRKPLQPCAQIVRRLLEGHGQTIEIEAIDEVKRFRKPHMEGPIPVTHIHCMQFKQYRGEGRFTSVDEGDNCFLIASKLGIVRNILKDGSDGYVVFEEFVSTESFFTDPLDSQVISIFFVHKLSEVRYVVSLNSAMTKYVLLPFKNSSVALPQMHTS